MGLRARGTADAAASHSKRWQRTSSHCSCAVPSQSSSSLVTTERRSVALRKSGTRRAFLPRALCFWASIRFSKRDMRSLRTGLRRNGVKFKHEWFDLTLADCAAKIQIALNAAMLPPVGALVPFQPPPPELGFPVKRRRVFGIPWCEACHTDRRWPVNLRVNTSKYGMVDLTLVTPDHPFLKRTPEVRCAIYSCIHTGNGVKFKHE